jgi:predicted PurR-regulated permease PerM
MRLETSNTAKELASATLVRVAVTAAVIVLLMAAWYTASILLLVFGGVLLAVLFNGLSHALSRLTRWSYGVSLSVVLLGVLSLGGISIWLRASAVIDQVDQMKDHLPAAIARVRDSVSHLPFGDQLAAGLSDPGALLTGTGASAEKVFSTTASSVAYLILVLFVTIYVAAQPGYYRRGLLQLVPPNGRPRAEELLCRIGEKLWWWLIARAAAMAVVGVLVTVGLMLLGIPLAGTFGLIAAMLDFVPNFGPIVAAIPAVLLALLQSPQHALYVALLYWGIQILEGYIVTPWFQKQAIDMPPALIVTAQLVLGAVFGTLGLVFATPLTAVVILLVDELYIKADA